MLSYSLHQLARAVSGQLTGHNQQVSHVITDSRTFVYAKDSLFVALQGNNRDGHMYIAELEARGVHCFLVSRMPQKHQADSSFIVVENVLLAFQQLAAFKRRQVAIPVVGITGSNGKTIVKEWLNQLLYQQLNLVCSPKSYNSQIGVPLSVWNIDNGHELGIFEAGISTKAEMEKLAPIIQASIGVFTNIGDAHQENFASRKQKAAEKLKLFTQAKYLIYCADYTEIDEAVQEATANGTLNTLNYAWRAEHIVKKTAAGATALQLYFEQSCYAFTIPFTDSASVENAVHVFYTIKLIEKELNQTLMNIPAFANLQAVGMRMEWLHGQNNCIILNDAYSNDIHSMKIALDTLAQQNQYRKKTVILSDILQSGKNSPALYKEVAEILQQQKIDQVIGIGKGIMAQRHAFRHKSKFYPTTEAFLQALQLSDFADEAILLKGARRFRFERICKRLQKKTHRTVLEINLNHLQHNLNYFRSLLDKDTQIMVMVKAFSYGSGSYEIANWLQHQRIGYLGVAYADEGVELRQAGISLPIMVMNPDPLNFGHITNHGLEPEIYSLAVLDDFILHAQQHKLQHYKVHLKIDTGMRRLGFEPQDIDALLRRLKNQKSIKVQSVFSHLVGTDNPDLDAFSHEQNKLFGQLSQKIQRALPYPILRHILNSAGIERFPDMQYNMVRLGIGLYGISRNSGQCLPISTLKTEIAQIKHIKKGESVGYNRNWIAQKNTSLATLPVGYADCVNRKLGNENGKVLINGKLCALVGNVCMDMCMVDITDIQAHVGQEVVVFGQSPSIEQLANWVDTIPYEILTSVSPRVKRVYFQE